MSDWITDFIKQTATIRSPESFRLWSAISSIACVLERRVWTATDVRPLHPNLYIVLSGLPASGKSNAIVEARKAVQASGTFVGPDDPTRASFFDELEKSGKNAINGMGALMYHAMSMLCREFGVLFKEHDELFPFLTDLYDSLDNFHAPRRTAKTVNIEAPNINILAGATPAAIGKIPERAWGEGFTSRVIFVYGTAPEDRRNYFKKRKIPEGGNSLGERLSDFFKNLHGEFEWDSDAQEAHDCWINDKKLDPVPKYGRLVNYNGRRTEFVAKLAMISAVSAERGLNVTLEDYLRAQEWLFAAEKTMPDVFRAIVQKSDTQLLQDAHYHFHTKYYNINIENRKAVTDADLWKWFEEKATSDKIPALIKGMLETGRMKRTMGNGLYIPANLLDPNNLQ